jgi:hypothetical protein
MTKGYIDKYNFVVWCVIPVIGIIVSLLHAEQWWIWQGDTPSEAQSFKAKIIVSVMSSIIGSCMITVIMKLVMMISYAFYRYNGAYFSQLVNLLGGYSISYIYILMKHGTINIVIIIIILIISIFVKQFAVISMGVDSVYIENIIDMRTPNYTDCPAISGVSTFASYAPIFGIKVVNSIMTPNTTFTNEYYDDGITVNINNIDVTFERELPYVDSACHTFVGNYSYARYYPTITSYGPWNVILTLPMISNNSDVIWVNCSLVSGHATALTHCGNNTCHTSRISNISYYDNPMNENGLGLLINEITSMLFSGSSGTMNPLQAWLLGGQFTELYNTNTAISNQSIDIIQSRIEILGDISTRVLCVNNELQSNLTLQYLTLDHYIYHILWKWPFYLLSILMFCFSIVCLYIMWSIPESRIISIEWLLNQYLHKHKFSHLSGMELAKTYDNTKLYIVDNNAGNIIITQESKHDYTKISNNKMYE